MASPSSFMTRRGYTPPKLEIPQNGGVVTALIATTRQKRKLGEAQGLSIGNIEARIAAFTNPDARITIIHGAYRLLENQFGNPQHSRRTRSTYDRLTFLKSKVSAFYKKTRNYEVDVAQETDILNLLSLAIDNYESNMSKRIRVQDHASRAKPPVIPKVAARRRKVVPVRRRRPQRRPLGRPTHHQVPIRFLTEDIEARNAAVALVALSHDQRPYVGLVPVRQSPHQ